MTQLRPHARPNRIRLVGAVAAAALAATVSVVLGAASPASATGTPTPWAPNGIDEDTNGVGGLTFYNSAGTAITSGSTSAAPFAAYAVGGTTLRTQDNLSATFLFTPQKNVDPSQWNGSVLGPSSTFPNTSAPAPVNGYTTPTTTGASNDLTLEDVSDSQTTSGDAGYANVFEIRQLTAKQRAGQSVTYNYADVLIDQNAHTWTLVWTPSGASAPAAPTTVTATAGDASATVHWVAPPAGGGAAVTGYVVEYSRDGGATWTPVIEHTTATSALIRNLVNGAHYVFRVSATSSAGPGTYSTPSSAVTPVADASALSIGATASVRYGYTATISGRLTDGVTRAALAGQPVTLYGRRAKSGRWSTLKTVTTSSVGAVSVTLKPPSYEQFYWGYRGTTTHKAVSSAARAVTVSQTVAVKATATKVKAKKLIKVYGTAGPAGSGQRVYLQVYNHGWKTVTSAVLHSQKLPNHKRATGYVLNVRPGKGSKLYRVFKTATSTLLAGASAQFHLAGK